MTPAELTVLEGLHKAIAAGNHPMAVDLQVGEVLERCPALFAELREAWRDSDYWHAITVAEYAGREAFREGKPRENPTGIEEWEEGWDAASDKADAALWRSWRGYGLRETPVMTGELACLSARSRVILEYLRTPSARSGPASDGRTFPPSHNSRR